MVIKKEKFEAIVGEVIDSLPDEVRVKIHNLAFFVEDFPTREQLKKTNNQPDNKYALLGVYEGHVQSSRRNMGVVTPDRITLFRVPIMQSCSEIRELRKRIEITVKHEIAHHFGSGELGARRAGARST